MLFSAYQGAVCVINVANKRVTTCHLEPCPSAYNARKLRFEKKRYPTKRQNNKEHSCKTQLHFRQKYLGKNTVSRGEIPVLKP